MQQNKQQIAYVKAKNMTVLSLTSVYVDIQKHSTGCSRKKMEQSLPCNWLWTICPRI